MSYDLIVFSPAAAPATRKDFMTWYEAQTEWAEDHTYDDPAVTTPALQAWLLEMRQTFPDLNSDEATGDNDYETDYCIGSVVIYAAFSQSLTEEAHATAHRLAQKHQVGFWDPSFEGPILLPENGELRPMQEAAKENTNPHKPWWKVW